MTNTVSWIALFTTTERRAECWTYLSYILWKWPAVILCVFQPLRSSSVPLEPKWRSLLYCRVGSKVWGDGVPELRTPFWLTCLLNVFRFLFLEPSLSKCSESDASCTSGIPQEEHNHAAPLHPRPSNVTQRAFLVSSLVQGNSLYRYSAAQRAQKNGKSVNFADTWHVVSPVLCR